MTTTGTTYGVRAGGLFAPARALARDVFALMKPRVMSLVLFTALAGMVAAPGVMAALDALVALVCIGLAAGGAGALNMWYEAALDARMTRTRRRPVPAGRIAPGTALGFGLGVSALALGAMALFVGPVATALTAFTIFFYAVVYTVWLKPRTVENIVIGGAAGALPPVIGWTAAVGHLEVAPFVLFAIICLWTPPHFWALCLRHVDEYARAAIPMLPVRAGAQTTTRRIFLYTLALAPVGMLPWVMGWAGPAYGAGAGLLGGVFVVLAFRLWRTRDHAMRLARAGGVFGYSLVYLFLLFLVLLADGLVRDVVTLTGGGA